MSNYIETAFMQQRTDFMKTLPDRRKRFSIPDGVDMYLDIEYVNDQNSDWMFFDLLNRRTKSFRSFSMCMAAA